MGDPTVSGSTQSTVTGVPEYFMGWDFIRELAKQDVTILRNDNLVMEWLARGKYAVFFGQGSGHLADLLAAAAPILEIIPREGPFVEQGAATAQRIFRVVDKLPVLVL